MSLLNACSKALVLRTVTVSVAVVPTGAADGARPRVGDESADSADSVDARYRAGPHALFKPGRNRLARALFLAVYLAAILAPGFVVVAADHALEVQHVRFHMFYAASVRQSMET